MFVARSCPVLSCSCVYLCVRLCRACILARPVNQCVQEGVCAGADFTLVSDHHEKRSAYLKPCKSFKIWVCTSIRAASLLEITIDQIQNYQILKDIDDIRRRIPSTVKVACLAFHLASGGESLVFTEMYIEQHKLPPTLVEIRLQEKGSTFHNVGAEKNLRPAEVCVQKNTNSYGKIMKFAVR